MEKIHVKPHTSYQDLVPCWTLERSSYSPFVLFFLLFYDMVDINNFVSYIFFNI